MVKNTLSEKLLAMAQSNDRRDTARLREIIDAVETTLKSGVLQTHVLAELHRAGFKMTHASFKSALQRIRNERRKVMPTARSENRTEMKERSVEVVEGINLDTLAAKRISREDLGNKFVKEPEDSNESTIDFVNQLRNKEGKT